MYVPEAFAMPGREQQVAFIRAHPFGLLVSADGAEIRATHAPFIVMDEPELRLRLHVARANPHWQSLDGAQVLCVFQGAHDFISASWYERRSVSVPTWNYAAVHCSGIARLTADDVTDEILAALVAEFEGPDRWSIDEAQPEFLAANRRAIVGIEIMVESIGGKVKYSQNRSAADVASVLTHLSELRSPLAEDMRRYFDGEPMLREKSSSDPRARESGERSERRLRE